MAKDEELRDRESDDDERRAAAVGPGTTGGVEAGQAGQPGGGQALGQPGGGHAAGQPSGTQPMVQPGGGHAAGQPSTTQPMTQPGGGHPAAQPSSAQPMSQPGPGQAGQPAAQPGTGYPAPPAGQPGATTSISIKGILIAAAAIVAVVIAIVAAFFLLRPNPPQQTTAQQSPTPTASPAVGGTPGAATPAEAAPAGPLFRGRYMYTIAGRSETMTVRSDCPTCDATVTAMGITRNYHWTGTGWTGTTKGDCGTGTITPTAVVDGIVQEASIQASGCGIASTAGTMTRVGD
jgi:hypothetical protein